MSNDSLGYEMLQEAKADELENEVMQARGKRDATKRYCTGKPVNHKTSHGEEIALEDLSDKHLENILNHIKEIYPPDTRPYSRAYFTQMYTLEKKYREGIKSFTYYMVHG